MGAFGNRNLNDRIAQGGQISVRQLHSDLSEQLSNASCIRLYLYMVVAAAVRRNKLLVTRATRAEVESVVKLWLRYAGDRSGGRQARNSAVDRPESDLE